jgi:predicted alpha/beta superfamily hydrolase
MDYRYISITFLLLPVFLGINGQNVNLKNTEEFSIQSKFVKEENYTIQVGLPADYLNSQRNYPVVIVLDGDKFFGIAKGFTDILAWGNEIQKVITIGIAYNTNDKEWWEKRTRDFTNCPDTINGKNFPKNMGGADNFAKFIKAELFPAIQTKYRANIDSTAIIGMSFGAMFCTYILFTQPDLFYKYIIVAPSLIWCEKNILKLENSFSKINKKLDKMVYLPYGLNDNKKWIIEPTNELMDQIQKHNYEGLKIKFKTFEDETHIAVIGPAMINGFKYIFAK